MSRCDPIHNHVFEAALFRRRVIIFALFGLVLIGILLTRLVYLQLFSFDYYTTLSKNNRVRLQAVAPPRGLIFDRNGEVLAENLPTYRLVITPEEVDNMDDTLKNIAAVVDVSEGELQRFGKALGLARPFEDIPCCLA